MGVLSIVISNYCNLQWQSRELFKIYIFLINFIICIPAKSIIYCLRDRRIIFSSGSAIVVPADGLNLCHIIIASCTVCIIAIMIVRLLHEETMHELNNLVRVAEAILDCRGIAKLELSIGTQGVSH